MKVVKKVILLNGAIRDTAEFYLILDFILSHLEQKKRRS